MKALPIYANKLAKNGNNANLSYGYRGKNNRIHPNEIPPVGTETINQKIAGNQAKFQEYDTRYYTEYYINHSRLE